MSDFGERIRLARLRRRITTEMLSQRAGITRTTLRKVENGNPAVSFGIYANVLFCLGLEYDLNEVAKDDEVGRRLQDLGLKSPRKRVNKREKE